MKTRWTARCRLSPEPTGLQKKRTRSTRRKSTGKNSRKSKSGFWYRLFDIMVIPEGRWRDERRTTIKSRQRSRPTLRLRSFPDCKRAGYQCHGRLRKSRITQGYVLHRQEKPLHLSQQGFESSNEADCLAHEIGHDRLHRALAKKHGLQEFVLYDMATKPEYEANIVAAEILLDSDEISNTSTTTGTPRSRLRGQCTQTSTWLL